MGCMAQKPGDPHSLGASTLKKGTQTTESNLLISDGETHEIRKHALGRGSWDTDFLINEIIP